MHRVQNRTAFDLPVEDKAESPVGNPLREAGPEAFGHHDVCDEQMPDGTAGEEPIGLSDY